MSMWDLIGRWPLIRQLTTGDLLGLGPSVRSRHSEQLRPRTESADRTVKSICPYCAVGCGQLVYVENEAITQIEGDPDSPVSRGRLCPKGAATRGLVNSPLREYRVKYRRPHAADWEDLPLDRAMDMIAERIIETRDATWAETEGEGEQQKIYRRTLGIANLGGATLDNEENYLIKKLLTGLGVVQVENQARI